MMVTVAEESLLAPLLSGCKTTISDFYMDLSDKLNNEEAIANLGEELEHQSSEAAAKICEHLENSSPAFAMQALQGLGFCLHHEEIAKSFKKPDAHLLLDTICKVVQETTEKTMCTRALWCIATQKLEAETVSEKVPMILDVIEEAVCEKNFKSMTVEHEGLNAYIRLLNQVPDEMTIHAPKWAKLVYPLLVHSAVKVRERAVLAMELGMPAILKQQTEIGKLMMADLKSNDKSPSILVDQISNLMSSKQEIFAMRVWQYYVTILGKFLHHGQLINRLLPFVELAFKNPATEIKCAAYTSWKTLIENFALNHDIISDGKRVKLIMQVFKLSNAKVESVAVAKATVWWIFVQNLKQTATTYFEMVVAPLLNFSIGGLANKSAAGLRTPTSRLGMIASPATPNIPGSPMPHFRALQNIGAQIIGRLLGLPSEDPNLPRPKFTLGELEHNFISGPVFFVKNAQLLISAVRESICSLQEDLDDGLLYHIWYALVAHVKNVVDTGNKSDASEVLSHLLLCLQHIVTTQCLKPEKSLKLIQAVLVLPAKALASSSFAIGTSKTGMMQGTPVLFLLDLLFNHRLLETCSAQERFFVLLEKLIESGLTNQNGALAFCKAVLQILDQSASRVENKETLWRMWSVVVNPLHEHISKTNEVNAGDALEHDFTCLYAALLLPLAHLLRSDFPATSYKAMMKTWTELYSTFSRLAAMVTNTESNICCEELCSRILSLLENNRDALKDFRCVETLSQVIQTVIKHVEFSGVSSGGVFYVNPSGILSPGKFMNKKKQRPLANLHSLVSLIVLVSNALHENSNEDPLPSTKKQLSAAGLQIAALSIIEGLSMIFTHLPSTTVIAVATEKLAPCLAQFFEGAAKKPARRMYSAQVLQKLEKLFTDFVTCITGRHKGPFDSEFLAHISPVLGTTFLHPRRSIKNQSMVLWNATFANSAPLEYPEDLKVVLAKVREKAPVKLPGWDVSEVILQGAVPASQLSQGGDTEVSLPNIVGLPSPHKKVGSFMEKVASPDVKKSPLKRAKSPAVGGARKKLGLDDLKESDFVVITPSTAPKKRVLTEHQREVLKAKSVLPAMYSALDASQDRSLMSQFNNTMDTTSAEASQDPFSFTIPHKKQDSIEKEEKQPIAQKTEVNSEIEVLRVRRANPLRRKSVTFALNPMESEKDISDDDNDKMAKISSPADETSQSPKKKLPTKLLGQSIVDNEKPTTDRQTRSVISNGESPIVLNSSSDEGTKDNKSHSDNDSADNESQASETILKHKPRDRTTRAAASSNKGHKSPERRSRSPKSEGMKKLENWFSVSPKKRLTDPPVILVEETQDFSPTASKVQDKSSPVHESMMVQETPDKMEVEVPDVGENDACSKRLFNLDESEVVPDSLDVIEKPPGKTPMDSVDYNPVVQLSRLPEDIVKTSKSSFTSQSLSVPSVESSDDIVAKITTPSETSVKKLKRRSSFRLSKVSQEKPAPISPLDMEDIIPSSQDGFGLEKWKAEVKKDVPEQKEVSKGEADLLDEMMTIEEANMEVATESENIETETHEAVKPDSVQKQSEESNPPENPDISPIDITNTVSSEDSNATLISKPRRGRPPKALKAVKKVPDDDSSPIESSETQDSRSSLDMSNDVKRSHRRRSVPRKYIDTDNKHASSTPEKTKKKKEPQVEVNLRPNETLVSRAYDSSQDSQAVLSPVPKLGRRKSTGKRKRIEDVEKTSAENSEEKTESQKPKSKAEETDPEDDIPIKILAERQKEAQTNSDDDDIPLTDLKKGLNNKSTDNQRNLEKENIASENEDLKDIPTSQSDTDGQKPIEEDSDGLYVEGIFTGNETTSTPNKTITFEEKKIAQKKKMLSNLSIDMKTSPVNKRLRSKVSLKLNRSLSSLQRRRPGSPGHRRQRTKSVSPLKRLRKTKAVTPSQEKVEEMISNEVKIEESTPEVSEIHVEETPIEDQTKVTKPEEIKPVEIKPESPAKNTRASPKKSSPVKSPEKPVRQSPRKSPNKNDPEPTEEVAQEMPSPRRSPRKLYEIEESPQKKSLSPTRKSLSLEQPETPTSATKHQSRARLILERSRLFAPRSSLPSGPLHARKKFTTLKPQGQSSDSPTKSILKPGTSENEEQGGVPAESGSPPSCKPLLTANSPTFRPIQLPRMYSPSASPSAGILKKRKLSGEVPMDSPSPPNKQRRVSFSEAVDVCTLSSRESPSRPVNRCLDMPAKLGRMTSPLVATTSKVTTTLTKFVTSKSETEKDSAGFVAPLPFSKKKEEPSQNSMRSTQESQLNCEHPVYPELLSCTDSIDQILPQLTSSTWVRGLGQLIRSKNIRTVGDLCRLTEYDVHNLPIRTPKVATVRQVLQAHATQWNLRKQRSPSTSQAPAMPEADHQEGSSEELENEIKLSQESPLSPKKPLPSVEDALAMSPIKEIDTSMESMATEDVHLTLADEPTPAKSSNVAAGQIVGKVSDIEDTEESDAHDFEFRDPFGSMPTTENPSEPQVEDLHVTEEFKTQLDLKLTAESSSTSKGGNETKNSSRKLLKDIEAMAQRLTPETLEEMPSSYLVHMHMHLNTMMTNVIVAQSNQCPLSPTTSQSSQSQCQ